MATCLVTGSMLATISVSVLKVASSGRRSAPMKRMFRRSVPVQGVPVTAAVGSVPGDASVDPVGALAPPLGASVGSFPPPSLMPVTRS